MSDKRRPFVLQNILAKLSMIVQLSRTFILPLKLLCSNHQPRIGNGWKLASFNLSSGGPVYATFKLMTKARNSFRVGNK